MRCDCNGAGYLAVKQTYQAGLCKTQRAVCLECGKVHTIISMSMNAVRGKGAYAIAQALREKRLALLLKEMRDASSD